MKILDSIYKRKYEKLKKDFESKVKKEANEIYKERQENWKIKEEEYRKEIRLKTLQIRQMMLGVKDERKK